MKLNNTAIALAASALALCLAAAPISTAVAKDLKGDALTQSLLKQPEFELISVSPDGSKFAISRRALETVNVEVHQRSDMKLLATFTAGKRGEVTDLTWLDDQRLLIGANTRTLRFNVSFAEPILQIVSLDGREPEAMPYNLFATIEGDTEHLLVYSCGYGEGNKGCNKPQIRRDAIGKLGKKGDLVIEGPPDTTLILNRTATAAFALKWEDDGTGRTYVYKPADKSWSLLNDGSVTGLEVIPLAASKDGKTAWLQSQRKDGPDAIERYDFASGKRTELHVDAHSDPQDYFESLDGQELLGASYEATDPKPYFWNTDHPDAQLYMGLQASFPGSSVSILSRSKDGNVLALGVSNDHDPGTWYLFDRAAKKAVVVAKRAPWLDPAQLARQTSFEVKARDGLLLHGVLTLPPKSTGKNLPLVVLPHGGPFGINDERGYDAEDQILAQHGYAVLQVNFRGSGSYGRAFEMAGARKWGAEMQDDLTDATRWAIAQGVADPQRICIFGMSYGGYAALMGPIHDPGLYRCVAAYAAPSDLTRMTKWGSHWRDDLTKKWLVKMVGEAEKLGPVSPNLNAEKINVPVLLAHGFLDGRVDVKHAQAMHRQLGKNHVPVEYVEYDLTGHSMSIPEHREDFYVRLLRLLDQNIGDGRGAAAAATAAGATSGGK
jgi:dipeptidyl aminopeptidase/acylaminoacyl peptidase